MIASVMESFAPTIRTADTANASNATQTMTVRMTNFAIAGGANAES